MERAGKGAVDRVAGEVSAAARPADDVGDVARGASNAEKEAAALPGHGHARHGSQTTIKQQTRRVQTGIAPDEVYAPTDRATRFDSPEAEVEAVNKARQAVNERQAAGEIDTSIRVDSRGESRLPRRAEVVTGYPGGYGSGVELVKDPVSGKPLPGRPVRPTGQDPNAKVVLEYDPATGGWRPVTQYPTNNPVTAPKQ